MLLRRMRSFSFSSRAPLSLGLEVEGVAIECRVMAMKGVRRVERRGLELSVSVGKETRPGESTKQGRGY